MALDAFGKTVETTEFRRIANRLQGTSGMYDAGVTLEVLAELAAERGLVVGGFSTDGGLERWTFEGLRSALARGRLVIPQVHYVSLPGHQRGNRAIDHYIVLTGFEGGRFSYNDSAFEGTAGQNLWISEERLGVAWRKSDFPFAALSTGPGPGMPSLLPAPRPVITPRAAPPIVEPPRLVGPAAAELSPSTSGSSAVARSEDVQAAAVWPVATAVTTSPVPLADAQTTTRVAGLPITGAVALVGSLLFVAALGTFALERLIRRTSAVGGLRLRFRRGTAPGASDRPGAMGAPASVTESG